MNASYILEYSISKALDLLKEWVVMIWEEDYPYIIAFILFAIICMFLNSKIKKSHSH